MLLNVVDSQPSSMRNRTGSAIIKRPFGFASKSRRNVRHDSAPAQSVENIKGRMKLKRGDVGHENAVV